MVIAAILATAACGNTHKLEDWHPAEEKKDSTVHSDIYNFASYNVGVFNKSGTNSMKMVARMMKEWDLDALSMNELDSCNTRSGASVYQLADFADAMGGWNYNFASAISYKGGSYGIGIVTPMDIKAKWSVQLPRSNDSEIRALSVVETEKFVFCSTHLGLTEQARLDQIDVINLFINSHFKNYRKPVILCGDFNAEPGSAPLARFAEDWTVISDTDSFTFSTSNPKKCIDYVLLYRNAASCTVKLSKVGTSFKSGDPRTASDHFPILVSVKI